MRRSLPHAETLIASTLILGLALPIDAWATTRWKIGTGNWRTDTNWTAGEPMPMSDAEISNDGTALITYTGECCRSLSLGTLEYHRGTVEMNAGSLTVSDYLLIGQWGRGTFSQAGGATSVGDLVLSTGDYVHRTGTYALSGTGQLSGDYEHVGFDGLGIFTQSGGNNTIREELNLGFNSGATGRYELSAGALVLTAGNEYIGRAGTGVFTQTGGSNDVQWRTLYLGYSIGAEGTYELNGGQLLASYVYVGEFGAGWFKHTDGTNEGIGQLGLGRQYGSSGVYELSDTAQLAAVDEYIGIRGPGTFEQTGGTNTTVSLAIGGRPDATGVYSISNGSLIAHSISVGDTASGLLSITDTDADITVTGAMEFGTNSSLSAVVGSNIHMTGASFRNANTDEVDLSGLGNLELIFEGGAGAIATFEVAGMVDSGFADNFALGTLTLGGVSQGEVQLVDQFDNGNRQGSQEALFVHNLLIGEGSRLDTNGLALFVDGNVEDLLDGWIGIDNNGRLFDSTLNGCGRLDAEYDSTNNWTTLIVIGGASAGAGDDQEVCYGEAVQLLGSATDYSSVEWSSSGDGEFSETTLLETAYTPGAEDLANGSVTLTLAATHLPPCTGLVSDGMIVTILDEFTVGGIVGTDQTICVGGDPSFMSVSPTGGSGSYMYRWYSKAGAECMTADWVPISGAWGSSYDPPPGLAETTSFRCLVDAISSPDCGEFTWSDNCVTVAVVDRSTVDAGDDQVLCLANTAQLAGAATAYSSIEWSTTGDGSFDDVSLINAVYTLGTADIAAGVVTLTLTVNDIAPCTGSASDSLTIFVETLDTDGDTVPDCADICPGGDDNVDCNADGMPDACEVLASAGCPEALCTADCSPDCNENCIPDDCELERNDCNGNSVPDECDLLGDFDGDRDVDFDDIPMFINVLLTPSFDCISIGDMNQDGQTNGLDVQAFVGEVVVPPSKQWYVDDDAPNDPGPGDTASSDPLEDGSEEHPFDAIQEAIDVAYDGDEVIILDGTYTGIGNKDLDFDGRAITVRSASLNPTSCVIDCQNSGRGFYFHSGESEAAVVEGLTITSAHASGVPGEPHGGGVYCDASSPTFKSCIITNNSSADGQWGSQVQGGHGGGLYVAGSAQIFMVDCIISGNTAGTGAEGDYFDPTSAGPGGQGGAVHCCQSSSMTMIRCVIQDNHAGDGGRGSYRWDMDGYAGARGGSGGGVYCESGTLTLLSCQILRNSAGNGGRGGAPGSAMLHLGGDGGEGGDGGGICAEFSDVLLVNLLVESNTSGEGGNGGSGGEGYGGDGGDGGSGAGLHGISSNLIAVNCTVISNSTGQGGAGGDGLVQPGEAGVPGPCGGVQISAGNLLCSNSILWENLGNGPSAEEDQLLGTPASIDHCCIEGWSGTLGGTGNIGDNPLLINSCPGFGSPCIDSGNNAVIPLDTYDLDGDLDIAEPLPLDLIGNARFRNDVATPDCQHAPGTCGMSPIVDMGACEYSPLTDCNDNGVPDDYDIDPTDPDGDGEVSADCQPNDIPDECDIASGSSPDGNDNGIPDECELAPEFATVWYECVDVPGQSGGPGETLFLVRECWLPGPQEFVIRAFVITPPSGIVSYAIDLIESGPYPASVVAVDYLGPFLVDETPVLGGHPKVAENLGQWNPTPVEGAAIAVFEFVLRIDEDMLCGEEFEFYSGVGANGWSGSTFDEPVNVLFGGDPWPISGDPADSEVSTTPSIVISFF